MQFDWSTLGAKAPTALVRARNFAHHALQWVSRAARANLPETGDDSQAMLDWDAGHAMLVSQPLPATAGEMRVGLRLRGLALTILHGKAVLDTYELSGRRESVVGVWLDSAMRALGLNPVGDARAPYSMPPHSVARGGAYTCSGEAEAFGELERWYAAAGDILADLQRPESDPQRVRCSPHHFDISLRIGAAGSDPAANQYAAIGMSPGDELYAQPYFRVVPGMRMGGDLVTLPAPGRWHTQGHVCAVALGEDILAIENPRAGLHAFFAAALATAGCPSAKHEEPAETQVM